jgi:transposase
MLVVETIAKIRRAYFVQGKSIKAICRDLRVSRKTVRKVLRSEDTEFTYERRVAAAAEDRAVARGAGSPAGPMSR